MQVRTEKVITTYYTVDFDANPDKTDILAIKLNNKLLGIRPSLLWNRLEFFPLSEGALIDKDPVLVISREEWEDLIDEIKYPIQCMSISYPAKLHAKVKERLKDLPIVLANISEFSRS